MSKEIGVFFRLCLLFLQNELADIFVFVIFLYFDYVTEPFKFSCFTGLLNILTLTLLVIVKFR